jgi:hypothetical protein
MQQLWMLILGSLVPAQQDMASPDIPRGFLRGARFAPFDWSGGEAARTPAAIERLQQLLEAAGVAFGVGGYEMHDVHSQDAFNASLGNLKIHGKTDALISPRGVGQDYAMGQARVVIDFKTDASNFASFRYQAEAELLGASATSQHPVLVVFTDLVNHAHILRMAGPCLLRWTCDIKTGVFVISEFLVKYSTPVIVHSGNRATALPPIPEEGDPASFLKMVQSKLARADEMMEDLAALRGASALPDWLEARDTFLARLGLLSGEWSPPAPMRPPPPGWYV